MNLLPRQHKSDLRLEAWRRYLLFLGLYLTMVLVSAATLLLPSLFYLQFQIGELEKTRDAGKHTAEYDNMTKGVKVVEAANTSLLAFTAYLKSAPSVTPLLGDLISRMPGEIYITNFSYLRKLDRSGTLKLTGVARHRDYLKAFAARLKESPFVSGEVLPPDAAFRIEDNTPFTLDISLEP